MYRRTWGLVPKLPAYSTPTFISHNPGREMQVLLLLPPKTQIAVTRSSKSPNRALNCGSCGGATPVCKKDKRKRENRQPGGWFLPKGNQFKFCGLDSHGYVCCVLPYSYERRNKYIICFSKCDANVGTFSSRGRCGTKSIALPRIRRRVSWGSSSSSTVNNKAACTIRISLIDWLAG